MKKIFEAPEIEIIKFETEEILSDSSPRYEEEGDGLGWD